MDVVFGAMKKMSTTAKEFIDGTAAQSKNFLLKNAFSSGRLSSDEIRRCLKYGICYFLLQSERSPLKSVILRTEFTETEKWHFQPGDGIIPFTENLPTFDMECNGKHGFRRIMLEYNITPTMIANSITGGELREFANPAKSGSLFFVTTDDLYILKTVRDYEARFFQSDLLNDYYHNLASRKKSMLARYFGMYAYNQQGSFLTLRFVVMSNIIPSSLPISECFDLKGSKKGRRASPEEAYKSRPTYKDLDFLEMHPEGILLPPNMYDRLAEILTGDVEILRGWKVIDYSLLMGIYNLSNPNPVRHGGAIGALGYSAMSTPMHAVVQPSAGWNLLSEQPTNMRALNCPIWRMFCDDLSSARIYNDQNAFKYGGIPGMNEKGEKLAIFLGIIDILQTYDTSKQLQNYVQTMQNPECDEYERSIIEPCQYAKRFLDFILGRVFRRGNTDLGTANIAKVFPHFNSHVVGQSSTLPPPLNISPNSWPGPTGGVIPRPCPVPDVVPFGVPTAPPFEGPPLCYAPPPPPIGTLHTPYPVRDHRSFSPFRESVPPYPTFDERSESPAIPDAEPPPYPTPYNSPGGESDPYYLQTNRGVSNRSPFESTVPYPVESEMSPNRESPKRKQSYTPYPVRRPPNIPDPGECIRKSQVMSMPPLPEESMRKSNAPPVKGMPPLPDRFRVFPDRGYEAGQDAGEHQF